MSTGNYAGFVKASGSALTGAHVGQVSSSEHGQLLMKSVLAFCSILSEDN